MIKISNENPNIIEYIENVYCLDNFAAFSLCLNGKEYKTAEHAFQYIKFEQTAPQIAEKIMEEVLFEKAIQNPYVKGNLLATGDKQIVEDCGADDDKDWGCGLDGTGQNNLGKIWMKVRCKIKNM